MLDYTIELFDAIVSLIVNCCQSSPWINFGPLTFTCLIFLVTAYEIIMLEQLGEFVCVYATICSLS